MGICPWHPRSAESAFPGVVPYQQGDVGPDADCCLWCLLSDGTACRLDYPEVGLQEGCDNRTGSLRYRCPDVHTGKQDQQLFSGVNIAIPYVLVGIFVLAVALVLSRIKLPDPRRAHEADTNEKVEEKPMRVMAFGFGMLTLFLYVAAQTGVNSFFINYAEENIHFEKQTASLYLAFGGMGLFFIGRLAGGVIMNYIQPRLVLLACAILTFVATLIVVVCSGTLSLIAFFALYLGESIMFPTIFSLALRDAGTKTKLASSLLIMTIVGGAIAPVIMGYIADTTGSMAIAFLIPLVCYGVIGTYALSKRHIPL